MRPARPEDAGALAELHADAMRAAYEGFVAPEHLADVGVDVLRERWREGLRAPEEGRVALVAVVGPEPPRDVARGGRVAEAVHGGRVAGFVTVGPSRDPDAREGDGELRALYVEPSLLRTGVGGALLGAAERELARDHAAATLWVLGPNEPARRFYERHGWRVDDAPFDTGRWSWAPSVRYRKLLGPGAAP